MDITELFRRLSFGELSNLSMGLDGSGEIREAEQNKLIHYTNEALLRLYSRFILLENTLILIAKAHETNYKLIKKFAYTSDDEETVGKRFIYDDAEQPFLDDVIKILKVSDVSGNNLPLNDVENIYSVFTPQFNVLQIPAPVAGTPYGVNYQARHPLLSYSNLDSAIELPIMLEGALTAYIAYLVFFHMNGQDNALKAAQHLATYEGICKEVQQGDLVNFTGLSTTSKFEERGWA